MPTIGVYADEFIELCGEAEGIQSGASYTKKTPKAVSILLRLFQPKSKIGENNMRKILLLLLCFCIFLNCSCSGETYTREAPYTVDLNGYTIPEVITPENNTDVYDKRHIDELLVINIDGIEQGSAYSIMVVEPIKSTSYYWDNGSGDRGGFVSTELKVVKILAEGKAWWVDNWKKEGDTFKTMQFFTVLPDETVVFPEYEWKNYKRLSPQSRKVMEVGKQYVYFYSSDFIIHEDARTAPLICYCQDKAGNIGEGCILNNYSSMKDYYWENDICNIHFGYAYEFSEEAYEASKAITTEYEAEGKTMNDGSYYHYHGMVVEAWERYSEKLNSDAEN